VRLELAALVDLAPLLVVQLDAPWFSRAVATDASERGCGVVATRALAADQQQQLARLAGTLPAAGTAGADPALLSCVASARWSTIVSSAWRAAEHINSLEVRSVATAIKWVLSFPSSFHRRLLVLSDSAVTVGAISKGRSSSPTLLRRLRSIAALCLGTGLTISVVWVPTAANPADEPSRRC
jgi:hypothetical protein